MLQVNIYQQFTLNSSYQRTADYTKGFTEHRNSCTWSITRLSPEIARYKGNLWTVVVCISMLLPLAKADLVFYTLLLLLISEVLEGIYGWSFVVCSVQHAPHCWLQSEREYWNSGVREKVYKKNPWNVEWFEIKISGCAGVKKVKLKMRLIYKFLHKTVLRYTLLIQLLINWCRKAFISIVLQLAPPVGQERTSVRSMQQISDFNLKDAETERCLKQKCDFPSTDGSSRFTPVYFPSANSYILTIQNKLNRLKADLTHLALHPQLKPQFNCKQQGKSYRTFTDPLFLLLTLVNPIQRGHKFRYLLVTRGD